MKKPGLEIPKNLMRMFTSDIGATEYFSYVGNVVSVEHALGALAILTPDFIERDGCIFWCPNVDEYDPNKYPMQGLRKDEDENLTLSFERAHVERYRNNFAVSQFFSKWEDCPQRSIFRVGLSEEDYQLCHIFAQQIVRYWKIALLEHFPDCSFEFEIADDLLDEYGVCLTFWQT